MEQLWPSTHPHGFAVKRGDDGWVVSLPHQCDEWTIVWRATQAEAIVELKRFIVEAHDALAALREGREFGSQT